LQGLAIGPGVAFPEAVEDSRECLLRRGLDVYVLLNVERQIFQCHCSFSLMLVKQSVITLPNCNVTLWSRQANNYFYFCPGFPLFCRLNGEI
jgi:hypothetical protein